MRLLRTNVRTFANQTVSKSPISLGTKPLKQQPTSAPDHAINQFINEGTKLKNHYRLHNSKQQRIVITVN